MDNLVYDLKWKFAVDVLAVILPLKVQSYGSSDNLEIKIIKHGSLSTEIRGLTFYEYVIR